MDHGHPGYASVFTQGVHHSLKVMNTLLSHPWVHSAHIEKANLVCTRREARSTLGEHGSQPYV